MNLKDIISARPWSDAIKVSSSRRQKSQVYTVDNPIIWSQMIQMLASGKIQTVGEIQPAAGSTGEWTL
ncbi:MAG: hypothetical protein HYV04_03955 [Deltaproteobacteria bacterium]|nr:hypothetical protein [Deltaproteobacteria bacterium]